MYLKLNKQKSIVTKIVLDKKAETSPFQADKSYYNDQLHFVFVSCHVLKMLILKNFDFFVATTLPVGVNCFAEKNLGRGEQT